MQNFGKTTTTIIIGFYYYILLSENIYWAQIEDKIRTENTT